MLLGSIPEALMGKFEHFKVDPCPEVTRLFTTQPLPRVWVVVGGKLVRVATVTATAASIEHDISYSLRCG